jgi:molybdopterin molybdotransferase
MNCPIPPLSLTAARTRILNTLIPLTATEPVDLAAASGRILAEPLRACRDLPPFACSAMDGYALRHADLAAAATLTVVGTVYAGSPWSGHLAAGQCVRIFTGAPLPAAADTVVMQEQVQRDGDVIRITGQPGPGEHVRPQGDETRCGEYLLAAGQRLTPEHIGLLASQGLASVRVRARPRVALLTTGDELCPLGQEPGPGQIYDSNRYLLRALLAEQGLTAQDQGIIPDQPERLRQALVQAAATADVIITTGGASVGDADWLVDAARQLGEVFFWQVAIKPGKPFLFGQIGNAYLFALPGNPVAVSVTFRQLVYPALLALMGGAVPLPVRFRAKTLTALKKPPGRLEFRRAWLAMDAQGETTVTAVDRQGSHQLSGFGTANGFIVLEPDCSGVAAGEWVSVEPLSPW